MPMLSTLRTDARFILGDRLLFDCQQDQLTDLRDRSGVCRLSPVTARLLRVMAASPRTILHAQQLLDSSWRAFGFEVCENSLRQAIRALRGEFAELMPEQMWIETIARRGYRLQADVCEDPTPTAHPMRRSTDRAAAVQANRDAGES